LLNCLGTIGMNKPVGQAGLQPNGWSSMLIRPAVAISSSLNPTQSAWEPSQIPASSPPHAPAVHSGTIPYGQPSPSPLAPANGYSSALYRIEGGSMSQMPSGYTQWSSYLVSEPHTSTPSATFGEQSRALGAHELLNNSYSQKE